MENSNRIPLQIHLDWRAVAQRKKQWWRWLVAIPTYSGRVAIGAAISIAAHVFVLMSYLGLSALHEPEVLEIREITFTDLTSEPPAPPAPKANESPARSRRPELAAPVQPAARLAALPTKSQKSIGKQAVELTRRLDMERKQAPINLDRMTPVAATMAKPEDILSISPAKGTRKDHEVKSPLPQIDLARNGDVHPDWSGLEKKGALPLPTEKQPEIDLGKMRDFTPASNPEPRPLVNRGAPPDTAAALAIVKQTRTSITGPLASRPILAKTVPAFPYWAKQKGVGATIALRFTVMENGNVKENIVVERTSGSGEWDHMVIASLKKWRFAPIATGGRQIQTGVITFQFVIE